MSMPASVRQQARSSAELHASIYGAPSEAPPPPAPPQEEQPPAPPQEEQPPAPVAEAAQPPQEEQPGDTNWEHRYRTVQGMMTAQQQRHQKELGELRNQLSTQHLLIQELRSSRAAPPTVAAHAPAPNGDPGHRYLKPDEVADYGEEMIDVMRRAAREAMEPEIQAVREQVQVSAADRMYQQLERAVPEWAQMNHDQGFLQWLAEVDPYAGQRRQDMLNTAATNLDVARVIAFFRGYLDQTAAVADQARGGNGAAPQARSPQVPLNTLVAPGRPKSPTGQSVAQSNGRYWTRAQVAEFYDDIRKGAFDSRLEERARIEKDLFSAAREGRIR